MEKHRFRLLRVYSLTHCLLTETSEWLSVVVTSILDLGDRSLTRQPPCLQHCAHFLEVRCQGE